MRVVIFCVCVEGCMGIIVVVLSLCMEKGFCFVPGQVAFGFYSGCWVVGCESVVLLIFFEETV